MGRYPCRIIRAANMAAGRAPEGFPRAFVRLAPKLLDLQESTLKTAAEQDSAVLRALARR